MLESRNVRLIVNAVVALTLSRTVFFLFDDPEGPNLLIVGVLALILMASSTAVHIFNLLPTSSGAKRLSLAIGIQIITAAVIFAAMRLI